MGHILFFPAAQEMVHWTALETVLPRAVKTLLDRLGLYPGFRGVPPRPSGEQRNLRQQIGRYFLCANFCEPSKFIIVLGPPDSRRNRELAQPSCWDFIWGTDRPPRLFFLPDSATLQPAGSETDCLRSQIYIQSVLLERKSPSAVSPSQAKTSAV